MIRTRQDKRSQIVEAAMKVFSREGFHQAKMDQVATEAGVGKGTVYLYFSSKEELLEYIFMTVTRRFLDKIRAIAAERGTAREKLCQIFEHALAISDQNRDSCSFLMEGPTGMSEDFKKWLVSTRDTVLEEIEGLIREGVRTGELSQKNPKLMAHVIIGAINSLVAARLWDGSGVALPETNRDGTWPSSVASMAVEVLWPSLAGDGTSGT